MRGPQTLSRADPLLHLRESGGGTGIPLGADLRGFEEIVLPRVVVGLGLAVLTGVCQRWIFKERRTAFVRRLFLDFADDFRLLFHRLVIVDHKVILLGNVGRFEDSLIGVEPITDKAEDDTADNEENHDAEDPTERMAGEGGTVLLSTVPPDFFIVAIVPHRYSPAAAPRIA